MQTVPATLERDGDMERSRNNLAAFLMLTRTPAATSSTRRTDTSSGHAKEIRGDLVSGRRDDFVLATKFTMRAGQDDGILMTGNSRKAMIFSVEQSQGPVALLY